MNIIMRVKLFLKDVRSSKKLKKQFPQIQVLTKEDTIEKIKQGYSLSRFGDGELSLMCGRSIRFQEENEAIKHRLKEVSLGCEKHLVCVPDVFKSKKALKKQYTKVEVQFWKKHLRRLEGEWRKTFPNSPYGNTFMTRFYLNLLDKSTVGDYVKKLKSIWAQKKLLIIEGEKSRLGVGNDLFGEADEIKRILCPSKNAFTKYDIILQAALKYNINWLIILAIGPTATVMAFDLCKKGYQALDLGHVDIEYEWFKMQVAQKIPIKNKHVNECNYCPEESIEDKVYKSQIAEVIG